MSNLEFLGEEAKKAERVLSIASTETKNKALLSIAEEITLRQKEWLDANEIDLAAAKENGMSTSLLDRLALSEVKKKQQTIEWKLLQ